MSVIEQPVTTATADAVGRELFGHVIDGGLVPSIDGATMDIVDPATGTASPRPQRAARPTSTAPRPSARQPSTTGAGGTSRRTRRSAACTAWRLSSPSGPRCSGRSTCSTPVCCARTPGSSSSSPSTASTTSPAGRPSCVARSRPCPASYAVPGVASRSASIGMIMPWNGPTAVFAIVAAALAAGNSVVLKPAEQTPMAAVLMAEVALEAGIPPGVFNVLQGTGRDVGGPLVDHPAVDALSFTGSVATGSAIQAAAAKQRQTGLARARRQEPVHRLPRRRPRDGVGDVDGRRLERVRPGLHVRHPRARPRQHLRRLRQPHRRGHPRHAHRTRHGPDERDGPGRVGHPARAHQAATWRSARTRAPSWSSAASRSVTAGSSTSRRSSPACATTCASPRRRSSGRSWASCRSAPRRRPTPSPTTSASGSPPACGPTTSSGPTAPPAPCAPAPCGSTTT